MFFLPMILADSDIRHDMYFGSVAAVNETGARAFAGGPWHLSASRVILLDKLPAVLIYYIKTDI